MKPIISNYIKAILTFLFVSMFILGGAQKIDDKKTRFAPLLCETDEARCTACKIFAAEEELLSGNISLQKFQQIKEEEMQWMFANCKGGGGKWDPGPDVDPNDPGDYCFQQTANLLIEDGYWIFLARTLSDQNGECKEVKREEIMRVPIPIEESEANGPHSRRMNCLPVITSEEQQYPFDSRNLYFEWRNNQLDICLPTIGCRSPDCFVCGTEKHKGIRDTTKCTNYRDFLKNLRNTKEEVPCQFNFVVPAKASDKVWLVSQSGGIRELTQVKASWFDTTFAHVSDPSSSSNQTELRSFLWKLSLVLAYDPETKIEQTPQAGDLRMTMTGNIHNQGYAMGLSPSEIFLPVNLTGLDYLEPKVMNHLVPYGIPDRRIKHVLKSWYRESNSSVGIIRVIPSDWNQEADPIACLGGATNEVDFEQKLSNRLDLPTHLDVQLSDGQSLSVWPYLGKQRQTWSKEKWFQGHSNPLLDYLSLIDPELTSFGERSAEEKVLFFFRENPDILWSWIYDDQFVRQDQLRHGSDIFHLTGNNSEAYLQALYDTSTVREQHFWLDMADDPDSLTFGDIIIGNQERLLLYLDSSKAQKEIREYERFNSHRAGFPMIQIALLDNQWDQVSSYYSTPWKRQDLLDSVYFDRRNWQIWLSQDRMAWLEQTNQTIVQLRLQAPYRNFHPAPLDEILFKVNDIMFIPFGKPSLRTLMESWLIPGDGWRRDWRANPLGYFDRCDLSL